MAEWHPPPPEARESLLDTCVYDAHVSENCLDTLPYEGIAVHVGSQVETLPYKGIAKHAESQVETLPYQGIGNATHAGSQAETLRYEGIGQNDRASTVEAASELQARQSVEADKANNELGPGRLAAVWPCGHVAMWPRQPGPGSCSRLQPRYIASSGPGARPANQPD